MKIQRKKKTKKENKPSELEQKLKVVEDAMEKLSEDASIVFDTMFCEDGENCGQRKVSSARN